MMYLNAVTFIFMHGLTKAWIKLDYGIIGPQADADFISCARLADGFEYCACRVNNTCVPLTTDWCETMNMEPSKTYLVKKVVTEILEGSLAFYRQDLPIYLHPGSELEFQFTLHTGWTSFAVNLRDRMQNNILHIKLRNINDLVFNSYIDGAWGTVEGYIGQYPHEIEVKRTLKIVSEENHFLIYLDAVLEWVYTYRLPANSTIEVISYFEGTPENLHEITFRASPLLFD